MGRPHSGTAVTSWRVRYRESGTTQWTNVSNIAAAVRARTIPDLDANTAYEVQLRATNTDGNSPDSATLTASTQETDTMGILQADLTEVQLGIETTAGTLVAATRKIPYVSGSYSPIVERKTLEERGTVLADTTDIVVRRGSELELTEELNTETLIAALLCSLANVAPTNLAGAQRWLFTPAVTAPSGLATATVEIAATDGGTDTTRAGSASPALRRSPSSRPARQRRSPHRGWVEPSSRCPPPQP